MLISVRTTQLPGLLLLIACLLVACQEGTEKTPNILKPGMSHRTASEKKVIVPPEVSLRWHAIKIAVIDKTRGTENIYAVPIGTTFKAPSTGLTILVESFLPSFKMEGATITTSSNELDNPGAKVRITDNGTLVFQGWLFTKFPNTHAVTHPKFGFSLIGIVPVSR